MKSATRPAANFNGIHRRTHRVRMTIETFQEDRNGSRYQMRTWRIRQGLSRASITKQSSPVTGMFSFAGSDYGLRFVTVAGSDIDGEVNAIPFWDEGLTGIGSSVYKVT